MRRVEKLLMLVAIGCAGLAELGQAAGGSETVSAARKAPFTVSKETTVITGPLRADGTVDYVAALNERYGKGVTPENNGFVKWLDVVGTGDEVVARTGRAELLKLCGAKETPAGARVWESYGDYMKRTKGIADSQEADDELDLAGRTRWVVEEHPDLGAYLKAQDELLKKVAEGAERSRWWLPLVSADGKSMFNMVLPSLGRCRDAARVLCARAVLRGTTGDVEGCWGDIATVRRLARQVGSGVTLLERLVGVAMDALAVRALAVVAADGKLTGDQCKGALAALDGLPAMAPMVETVDIGERWCQLDIVQWIAMGQGSSIASVLRADADLAKIVLVLGGVGRDQVVWDVVFKKFNGLFDDQVRAMRDPDVRGLRAGMAAVNDAVEGLKKQSKLTLDKGLSKQPEESREAYTERMANLLVGLFLPEFGRAEEVYRRSAQDKEMVRVVLAAAAVKARTGKWPGKLEELVPGVLKELPKDMYSAGGSMPFRYVVTGRGVWVYSVGENGRDDGGVREGTEKDDLGVGVK